MAKAATFQDPIFQDEDKAREALEAVRWPDGPICPHCGNADPDRIARVEGKKKSHRPGLNYCNECKGQFTVTVGTVFERSKVPLTKWWMAAHMFNSGKNGTSAHEIHRNLGVTYKTAWFMMHRLREAMTDLAPAPMGGAGGQIQADETYHGNTSKRAKGYKRGHRYKQSIVALVDPAKGHARAFHLELGAGAGLVRDLLVTNASRKSTLVTDESKLYTKVGAEFAGHQTMVHTQSEYVNKDGYTTNNVENFFGMFKRGMRGTYVFCGDQHLQRYLNEFAFRYSHRSGLGINDRCDQDGDRKRGDGQPPDQHFSPRQPDPFEQNEVFGASKREPGRQSSDQGNHQPGDNNRSQERSGLIDVHCFQSRPGLDRVQTDPYDRMCIIALEVGFCSVFPQCNCRRTVHSLPSSRGTCDPACRRHKSHARFWQAVARTDCRLAAVRGVFIDPRNPGLSANNPMRTKGSRLAGDQPPPPGCRAPAWPVP